MLGHVTSVTISLGLFTYVRFAFVKAVKVCKVALGWVELCRLCRGLFYLVRFCWVLAVKSGSVGLC